LVLLCSCAKRIHETEGIFWCCFIRQAPRGGILGCFTTAISWKNLFPRPWPRPRTDGTHQPTDLAFIRTNLWLGVDTIRSEFMVNHVIKTVQAFVCPEGVPDNISQTGHTYTIWFCIIDPAASCPSLSSSASSCAFGIGDSCLLLSFGCSSVWRCKELLVFLRDLTTRSQ
jgi:hypothetical protein